MCGIFCSILHESESVSLIEDKLKDILRQRGPDASSVVCVDNVVFGGNVLWQQGKDKCVQPLEYNNIILLFNGDAFNVDNVKSVDISDTEWLASTFSECKSDAELCHFLRTLEGPFSLIFYNRDTQDLYFCRDSLGRNSLIIERNRTNLRILSTSYYANETDNQVMELPPLGLFKINVLNTDACLLFPWFSPWDEELKVQGKNIESTIEMAITFGETIGPRWLHIEYGSKDSFNFYDIHKTLDLSKQNIYDQLLSNKQLLKELDTFSFLLEKSVKNRVLKTQKFCKDCIKSFKECSHSKIAILFSGGIDCSILAVLADKFVDKNDSIELINVAFESLSVNQNKWDVPDRCTAKSSLVELKELCPLREWKLIEVNVTREELQKTLHGQLSHLIYPLETILDESIGSAFWFASRGQGTHNGEYYESTARVVIVGSGADELFGGYVRHRNAYLRCNGSDMEKEANVYAELEKDWLRIPSRNLARDDRVIADNGKTSRAPYIEENLVQYTRSLRSNQRCCFLYDEGVGDKLFLRACGYRI